MVAAVKIKQWGNGLGVRLTSTVARAAGLQADTLVRVSVEGSRVIIEPAAPRKLTLTEKLAAFDPKKHGGEFAVLGRVGAEAI
jgi:antitoxin MazE